MMPKPEPVQTEQQRREIFKALVEAQDKGASVAVSRKAIAKQFGLSEQQVGKIESEGLDQEWPPLS